jgi:hypothetical protein
MDVSGRPHEGWMTLVPLIVLVGIVMFAFGGPVAFMNTINNWFGDLLQWGERMIKSFV